MKNKITLSQKESNRKYNQAEKLVGVARHYYVSVIAKKYDVQRERKMEQLAKKLAGFESGAGWGGERDIGYVFTNKSSIKNFLKKIKEDIFIGRTTVSEYVLDWEDRGTIKL